MTWKLFADEIVADGAIVELGAEVDADGIHPDEMPPLAPPLAEWVSVQTRLQATSVQAALTGDPAPALEALIEDPASPADEGSYRQIFDELRELQAAELPF